MAHGYYVPCSDWRRPASHAPGTHRTSTAPLIIVLTTSHEDSVLLQLLAKAMW